MAIFFEKDGYIADILKDRNIHNMSSAVYRMSSLLFLEGNE